MGLEFDRATDLVFGDGFYPSHLDDERASALLAGAVPFRDALVPRHQWRAPTALAKGLQKSWLFFYHSKVYTDVLRRKYLETGDALYKDAYLSDIDEWLKEFRHPPKTLPTAQKPGNFAWYDMSVAWRAIVLVAAASCTQEDPDRYVDDIKRHRDVLLRDDFYAGIGNHALHQNNALLTCAAVLDDADSATVALDRIEALLAESVDEQGVSLEGSVAYHVFNAFWWLETERRVKIACEQLDIDRDITFPDMRPFAAAAFAPDGRFVMLGDTCLSHSPSRNVLADKFPQMFLDYLEEDPELSYALSLGQRGAPPERSLAVFQDGFAFSRGRPRLGLGGRERNESLVSGRFGKGLAHRVHAHDDAGSVTFYVDRWRVLEDGGMFGYYGGDAREFVKSSRAHNVIDTPGRPYYRSAVSPLLWSESHDDADSFRLKLPVRKGVAWYRTVAHLKQLGMLYVEDIVTAPDDFESGLQLWNLGDGFSVHSLDETAVIAEARGCTARFSILDDCTPLILNGSKDDTAAPQYGWRSTFEGEIHPVQTIGLKFSTETTKLRTLVSLHKSAAEAASINAAVTRSKSDSTIVAISRRTDTVNLRVNHNELADSHCVVEAV